MTLKNNKIDLMLDIIKILIMGMIGFILAQVIISLSWFEVLKMITVCLGIAVVILGSIWFLIKSKWRLSFYRGVD